MGEMNRSSCNKIVLIISLNFFIYAMMTMKFKYKSHISY